MSTAHDTHALLAHVGWVRALAAQLVHDGAAAEDLAQETLLAAWQRPPRDPSALRGYLGSVLRNLLRRGARDADRRENRERASAHEEVLPSAADTAERLATHRHVVDAVEALAEPYRTVVLLRHFEELPPRRIAAHLGVPVKTVDTRLTRGHALLRERLDADHGGDRRAWALALARFAGADPIGRASPSARTSSIPAPVIPWVLRIGATAAAVAVVFGLFLAASAQRSAREAEKAALSERKAFPALLDLFSAGPDDHRLPTRPGAERTRFTRPVGDATVGLGYTSAADAPLDARENGDARENRPDRDATPSDDRNPVGPP